MVFFVILVNLFITLFNIYLAIKIWQLRRTLMRITKTLSNCERKINFVLSSAPQAIFQKQKNLNYILQNYQLLQLQLQKISQLLWLLNLMYRWGRRSFYSNRTID